CHFSRNDGRAGSAERLVHGLSGRRVVFDRPPLAREGLLRSVAMPVVVTRFDIPKCRLLAVPTPVRPGCSPDRVPTGLVLPMIMAAGKGKPVLGPDNLGAHVEAGRFKRLLDLTRMPARMPDIGD